MYSIARYVVPRLKANMGLRRAFTGLTAENAA
jgi:hypothetical protein